MRNVAAVNGVKTGHTNRAGYVLVGSARRGGVTVVSVVLGEPSERSRDADSLALLRYGLNALRAGDRAAAGPRRSARSRCATAATTSVDVVAGSTVRQVLREGVRTSVTVTGLPQEVDGPLPRGSRVGTAIVRAGDEVLARVPVVTARPVPEAGLGTRLSDLAQPLADDRRPDRCLLVCSLPLVMLRRRAMRRRRALDAEHRRARRREETPV